MQDKRRHALVIGIIVLILAGICLGMLVADFRAKHNATERAEIVLVDSAREQAATFSAVLNGRIQVLRSISSDLSLKDTHDLHTVESYLLDLAARNDLIFDKVELADRSGRLIAGEDAGTFVADRRYYTEAIAGRAAMECIVGRSTGKTCIALAVPCYQQGEISGVLLGLLYEEELRALLSSQAYSGSGYSFLVDRFGQIIVNAEETSALIADENLFDFLRAASFTDGKSVAALANDFRNDRIGTLHYTVNSESRVAAFVPLSDAFLPDNDWYVFNIVASDELAREIATARRDSIESMSIFAFFTLSALALFRLLELDYRKKMQKDAENIRQREEQFRIMAEQSGHAVFRYDIAAQRSERSAAVQDKFGGDDVCEDVCETCIRMGIIAEESIADYRAFYAEIAKGKTPVAGEFLMCQENGEYRWYRHVSTTIFDKEGRPQTAIISYYDCTEQRERELAYAKWQQDLNRVSYDNAALYEWNLSRDLCEGTRGTLAKQLASLPVSAFDAWADAFAKARVFDEDRPQYAAFMNREHLIGLYYDKRFDGMLDYRYIMNDGALRWHRVSVQMVPYPDTQDIKLYVTFLDIDEEKRDALLLIARSEQDSLTGALNRETFITRVEALFEQAPASTHAMLMLDIDEFKNINDQMGHNMGDEVLVDFVRHVRSVLRASDLLGRMGGDEFMVCLPDMPYDAAIGKKAQQLCAALRHRLNHDLLLSVSIGIAIYPRDGRTFTALYNASDAALYHVKGQGKDAYAFYQPGMKNAASVKTADVPYSTETLARRTVLLVSDAPDSIAHLTRLLAKEYELLHACGISELTALLDEHVGVYAAILDTDTPFGRNALRSVGMRMHAGGVSVITLCSDNQSDAQKTLMADGADFFFPRPIDDALLLLCLERLRLQKDIAQNKLQSEYHRLQTADDLRYREVLDATETSVFIYDTATRAYQVDLPDTQRTACRFDGRPLDRILIEDSGVTKQDISRFSKLLTAIASGEQPRGSLRLQLKTMDGNLHWFEIQVKPLTNAEDLTPKLLLVVNDVNEEVEASEALRYRAERDALTGLYNRETFLEKASALILEHEPGYYVMACFDIDKFKVINDQHGTEKGDEVLCQIANLFHAGFGREGGICCRIMADHFAVLYPVRFMETSALRSLRDAARKLDGSLPPINFSIGRYIVDDLTLSVSAMYDRAMLAEASIKGRFDTQIALYDESMREHLLRAQEITSEMNDALHNQEFELWLQPQYNHSSGALIGAEALVRWRHPRRGWIPPDEFVPVFEKNGFIYELDKFIWARACRLLRGWLDEDRNPLPLSVNVSRYDLFRDDFFETFTGYLETNKLPVDLLRVEITESAFADASGRIIQMVKRLTEYGFTIEIDDFGSGYSSLNTLKDVPANVLKLDMRFLESKENSQRGGNILESVIRMAMWLNMPVIAEGVETLEQADFLKSIGCSYVQGFLYAKPMPVADYEALAEKNGKESELVALKTIKSLDNNAFWDPASMETLIFNSYVGGACIFEYQSGNVDLLRANENYAHAIGGEQMGIEEALKVVIADHMDDENRKRMQSNIQQAIDTGAEATCELRLFDLDGQKAVSYIRSTVRVIARAGDRFLCYCAVDNCTAQREAELAIVETSDQLRFLNNIARDLLTETNPSDAITAVLEKILSYFRGSRAYVFEVNPARATVSNTFEVCAIGVSREIERLQDIPLETLAYWFDAFEKRNHIYIESVRALGGKRIEERRMLLSQQVQSMIAVPLRRDAKVIGFLGVDDPKQKQKHAGHLEALGDYMAVILTRRDLTAKIQSDSDTLDSMIHDTPGGFARIKAQPDGTAFFVNVNEAFCRMFDMSYEAVMGRYGIDALWGVHPDDAPVVTGVVREMLESGESHSFPCRMRSGNGEYVSVSVYIRLTKSASGETYLNAYYTNASVEAQYEEQRKEFLDNLPCGAGVYEVFTDYVRILYLNKQYAELVGRRVESAGISVLDTVLPVDKVRMFEELHRAISENRNMLCDLRILHGNGGYRPFRMFGKVARHDAERTLVYAIFEPADEKKPLR